MHQRQHSPQSIFPPLAITFLATLLTPLETKLETKPLAKPDFAAAELNVLRIPLLFSRSALKSPEVAAPMPAVAACGCSL